MKRFLTFTFTIVAASLSMMSQLTLDRCLELADENYPLIKKYDIVAKTMDISLSDINKGWLPKISIYGQSSIQNSVPEFPAALTGMLDQYGQDFKGMGHAQYRIGIDLTQNIWDGGLSKSQRDIRRAGSAVSSASLNVQIYAMHEKVQKLFFGILLIDRQIEQMQSTVDLLSANLARMKSMERNGMAMQSDIDMIEAQILSMRQHIVEAAHSSMSYRDMLGLYIGISISDVKLELPSGDIPLETNPDRPELHLFDARIGMNEARLNAVASSIMPRIGLFAQAYYGYPGLNYFQGMKNRDASFNTLAGIRLSWNIDSFYTQKNARNSIALDNADTETDRDLFLFNTRLQTSSLQSAINSLRIIIEEDEKIALLRGNVRKTAESQLTNGVIDTTDLLAKINDENQAQLNAHYHQIQLLQNIYQLKHTLNR